METRSETKYKPFQKLTIKMICNLSECSERTATRIKAEIKKDLKVKKPLYKHYLAYYLAAD